jgi:hypothetical protein
MPGTLRRRAPPANSTAQRRTVLLEEGVTMTAEHGQAVGAAQWSPDVLGAGFEQLTMTLTPDDEGAVTATLVRRVPKLTDPPDSGIDVLYLHGWSDYFFQIELADFFAALGIGFYAVDLRKYGRSRLPEQTPGFVADLATYDEDLAAALAVMGHDGTNASPRKLTSTGVRSVVSVRHRPGSTPSCAVRPGSRRGWTSRCRS